MSIRSVLLLIALLALAVSFSTGSAAAQSPPLAPYPQCLQTGTTPFGMSNPNDPLYTCPTDCAFSDTSLTGVYASNGAAGNCWGGTASGESGIGPDDSSTWSEADPQLIIYEDCGWTDTPEANGNLGVTLTVAISGGSLSISAVNWDPSNAHNWAGGALYQLGVPPPPGFTQGCVNSNGCLTDSLEITGCCQNPPPNYTVPNCPIAQQSLNSLFENAVGNAASGAGQNADPTAAQSRAARVSTTGDVTTRRVFTRKLGRHRISCPAGSQLLNAESAMLYNPVHLRPEVHATARAATAVVTALAPHEMLGLQVTCRTTGQMLIRPAGGLVYGTEHGEAITLGRHDRTVFGGNGADRITSRRRASVIIGGNGNDAITVSGADDVAQGGSGADVLVAAGAARALLIGGVGHDLLVARHGSPHLNAADGQPGDTIVCQPGTHAVVRADHGDVIYGACFQVRWN
ncbi:MAG: calcium-binding protein [Gaiellales bacterium]